MGIIFNFPEPPKIPDIAKKNPIDSDNNKGYGVVVEKTTTVKRHNGMMTGVHDKSVKVTTPKGTRHIWRRRRRF